MSQHTPAPPAHPTDALVEACLSQDLGPDEAAELYGQVAELQAGPDQEMLRLREAELRLEAGQLDRALKTLRQLRQPDGGQAMVRQRARLLGGLADELRGQELRPQLAEALGMLLPLQLGPAAQACASELASLSAELEHSESAVTAYLQALSVWRAPPGSLLELGRALNERGATDQLLRLIEQVVASPLDPRVRAPLMGAAAALVEDHLGDLRRAVTLWWEAWAMAPPGADAGNSAALYPPEPLNLKRLHVELQDWEGYCEVVQREVVLEAEPARKAELLAQLATFQARVMGAGHGAGRTLCQLLELSPGGAAAVVRGLAELDDPQLRQELDAVTERAARALPRGEHRGLALRRRLRGHWSEGNAGSVLAVLWRLDASDLANQQLIKQLLDTEEVAQSAAVLVGDALKAAAPLLLPLLCADADSVPRLMDLAARLERGGHTVQAASFQRQVVRLSPDSPQGKEAAARLAGGQRDGLRTASALAMEAAAMAEGQPDLAANRLLRAAHMAASTAGMADDEVQDLLRQAVELSLGGVPELLPALEQPLAEAGLHLELAQVLEAEVKLEQDLIQRKYLLRELARVHQEAGHHLQHAAAALQEATELDPDDLELAQQLRELHRELADHGGHARTLESLLARTTGRERVSLMEQLGALYAGELREEQAAAMHYEELLAHVPDHAQALPFCRAAYERAGDYVSVVRALGEAAAVSQDRAARARLHGEAALVAMQRLTDPELAIHHWQEAIFARPDDAELRQGLQQVLVSSGRWQELEQALLAAIPRTPAPADKVPVFLELARVARDHRGDDHAAARHLHAALQLVPADSQVLGELEQVYERLGQWRRLAVMLRRHAGREADLDARHGLLHRAARILLVRLGQEDEALEICRGVLAASPGHRDAAALVGEILGKRGLWEEKLELLKERAALEDQPQELGRVHLELGRVLFEQLQDPEAAAVHFGLALELSDAPGDVVALLRRLFDASERTDRLLDLLEVWAAKRDLPAEQRALASCEVARFLVEHVGDAEAALARYQQALELDPDCLPALLATRDASVAQQRWQDAAELGQRAAERITDAVQRAALLVDQGRLLARHLDDADGALAAVAQALEASPNDSQVLALAGTLNYRAERWEQAARHLTRLQEVEQDLEDIHEHCYRLAFSLEQLGQDEDAFRTYIRSFTRAPMYLPTLERLVELCFQRRQWENTRRIAETLLDSYSDHKTVEEQAALWVRIAMCELHQAQREAAHLFLKRLVLEHDARTITRADAWRDAADAWAATAHEPRLLPLVSDEALARVGRRAGRALELVPEHLDALDLLAALAFAEGQHEAGLGWLELAVQAPRAEASRGAVLLVYAGEVALRQLGSARRAEEYYQWALRVDPACDEAAQRLQRLTSPPELPEDAAEIQPEHQAVEPPPPPEDEPRIKRRDTQPIKSGIFHDNGEE